MNLWVLTEDIKDRKMTEVTFNELIQPQDNDDPRFIEIVSAILRNSLNAHQPQDLWIVHIDHWFDTKWLQFSGKILGAGLALSAGTAVASLFFGAPVLS